MEKRSQEKPKLFKIPFGKVYIQFPDDDPKAIALVRDALDWFEGVLRKREESKT